MKNRVVNMFAGPGAGKTKIAADVFANLKHKNVRAEYVPEFIKGAVWEGRGEKIFSAQEYIFGKQSFNLSRVASEVDVTVTDSPIILGVAYTDPDGPFAELRSVIRKAHDQYDSLNVFVKRSPGYDHYGRNQSEQEAIEKDEAIIKILQEEGIDYIEVESSRFGTVQVLAAMRERWGDDITQLATDDQEMMPEKVEIINHVYGGNSVKDGFDISVIPLEKDNRMVRVSVGNHKGTLYFRVDLWYKGFRLSYKPQGSKHSG